METIINADEIFEGSSNQSQQSTTFSKPIEINQTSQDLGSIITSAKTRRIVWSVYVIAGLTLGGLSAWFTTTESSVPIWLQGALAVSAFLAAPFGTLAIANIQTKK